MSDFKKITIDFFFLIFRHIFKAIIKIAEYFKGFINYFEHIFKKMALALLYFLLISMGFIILRNYEYDLVKIVEKVKEIPLFGAKLPTSPESEEKKLQQQTEKNKSEKLPI